MEQVAQPPEELELHLLTDWGDPGSRKRGEKAGILSILLHAAVIITLALLPADILKPPENEVRRVTPLIDPPLTELTQKAPNTGKITKEFNAAEVEPRPRIQIPAARPSTTRPQAPRPAPIPSMPAPKPQAVPLPEAPTVAQNTTPKIELPQMPQIQPQEKKPVFENPSGPPVPLPPSQRTVPIPDTSVGAAVRNTIRGGSGGGVMVGDPDAIGPGGVGSGINQAPSPGAPASAMQLLSDPMGVDFRPYLTQILTVVRRNWFSVMPESAKLGLRGKVAVQFYIAKNGVVTKVVLASQSGARALDQAAVVAISMSNPFPSLPPDYKGDRIALQFNFAYNVVK